MNRAPERDKRRDSADTTNSVNSRNMPDRADRLTSADHDRRHGRNRDGDGRRPRGAGGRAHALDASDGSRTGPDGWQSP